MSPPNGLMSETENSDTSPFRTGVRLPEITMALNGVGHWTDGHVILWPRDVFLWRVHVITWWRAQVAMASGDRSVEEWQVAIAAWKNSKLPWQVAIAAWKNGKLPWQVAIAAWKNSKLPR